MKPIPPPPPYPPLGSAVAAPGGAAPVDPPCPAPSDHDTKGRVTKGNRGRRPGSRNKRTLALEALFEGEAEAIARVAVGLALRGDSTSIKMILDRLAPPRKSAPIELPHFPKITTVADVPAAHAYLIRAVASGRITPDESAAVAATLDRYCAAVETTELEARLTALEERHAAP